MLFNLSREEVDLLGLIFTASSAVHIGPSLWGCTRVKMTSLQTLELCLCAHTKKGPAKKL